jgi:hypothetical protein
LVRRWIELRIRKVLLLLPELGLPAADRIRELKPKADAKYRKIIDIITGPHALIAAYQRIQSKLVKKEGMTNGRSSRKEIDFLSALIGDGSSTSQNNCARGNTSQNK